MAWALRREGCCALHPGPLSPPGTIAPLLRLTANTPTHARAPLPQVSHIQTEKLLIKLVGQELARRKAQGTFRGKFSALSHFFG